MGYFGFGRLALARWQLSCLAVVALLGVTDRWEGPSPGIPEGILGYRAAGIPRAYFRALFLPTPRLAGEEKDHCRGANTIVPTF